MYIGQTVNDWDNSTDLLSLYVTDFVLKLYLIFLMSIISLLMQISAYRQNSVIVKNNHKLKKLGIEPGLDQEYNIV